MREKSMKRALVPILLLPLLVATGGLVCQERTDSWPQTVLITNDDGIEMEGLQALVRAFAPVAKIYVVAPLVNRSGSTNYVSAIAARAIEIEPVDLGEGVVAYGVDGFPADAVSLALGGLLDEWPDLVISGVNTGPNLAGDWNLSGTVGAAQIAAFFGVPAIAVSGYTDDEPETLETAAHWIVELARSSLVRELEPGGYLAVSIPRVPLADIKGVDVVRRGLRQWRLVYERSSDEPTQPNRERWSLRFEAREIEQPAGTDLAAFAGNRIAVVPMRVDEHDYELLRELQGAAATGLPGWPPSGSH